MPQVSILRIVRAVDSRPHSFEGVHDGATRMLDVTRGRNESILWAKMSDERRRDISTTAVMGDLHPMTIRQLVLLSRTSKGLRAGITREKMKS